jgi:hypothetical protein
MVRYAQASLCLIAVLAACSDNPFNPTTENVVGDYNLQTLTTTDTSGTTDWVTAGATWTMSLAANGTTTGHLFIPGAPVGGADFNADMAGNWTLSGDSIQFDQTADSFVRDMSFGALENRLTGDHTFSGTRVRLVLTK